MPTAEQAIKIAKESRTDKIARLQRIIDGLKAEPAGEPLSVMGDPARRIAQLERENALLRAALEKAHKTNRRMYAWVGRTANGDTERGHLDGTIEMYRETYHEILNALNYTAGEES